MRVRDASVRAHVIAVTRPPEEMNSRFRCVDGMAGAGRSKMKCHDTKRVTSSTSRSDGHFASPLRLRLYDCAKGEHEDEARSGHETAIRKARLVI